jgi:hypothetical protein
MLITKMNLSRLSLGSDLSLLLICGLQIVGALCIALLCKANLITRLTAAWDGLDLIIRDGEIVGLRP